jgi:hypothetical protein
VRLLHPDDLGVTHPRLSDRAVDEQPTGAHGGPARGQRKVNTMKVDPTSWEAQEALLAEATRVMRAFKKLLLDEGVRLVKETAAMSDGLICDVCGMPIRCIEDAWVEWLVDGELRGYSLRVVHHRSVAGGRRCPRTTVQLLSGGIEYREGCCRSEERHNVRDIQLDAFKLPGHSPQDVREMYKGMDTRRASEALELARKERR